MNETGCYMIEHDVHTYYHPGDGKKGLGYHSSNIDRAYTNMHVAWAQDRDLICDVLQKPHMTDKAYHLPITFGISDREAATSRAPKGEFRIPQWTTEVQDWSDRVEAYHKVTRSEADSPGVGCRSRRAFAASSPAPAVRLD